MEKGKEAMWVDLGTGGWGSADLIGFKIETKVWYAPK